MAASAPPSKVQPTHPHHIAAAPRFPFMYIARHHRPVGFVVGFGARRCQRTVFDRFEFGVLGPGTWPRARVVAPTLASKAPASSLPRLCAAQHSTQSVRRKKPVAVTRLGGDDTSLEAPIELGACSE
ncbi:hypothetical protein Taro_019098 [Colocasia esculenta]|uniref:Uncharacterized protein n=1 Tax=Colocasia esculenta TaxID=4460 RepID=A0A843USH8_COLES|nr:hypothetical protein [Colocasia esculenta]